LYQPKARASFWFKASQKTAHENVVPLTGTYHKFLKVLVDRKNMGTPRNADFNPDISLHDNIIHAECGLHDLYLAMDRE